MLGTFNGAAFLEDQLSSLEAQTYDAIDLFVSDDGSSDGTDRLLDAWARRWKRGVFTITQGPCSGFAANFRSMIVNSDPDTADWFAFCDQDDIWMPGKLESAIKALSGLPADRPRLYCGRTQLMGEQGEILGYSPLMTKPPAFRNALVQSIAGGNTMVMDRTAFRLVREACRRSGFVSHDWWSYLVVTGAGGHVIYDPNPQVKYRQHDGNIIGSNNSFAARMARIGLLFSGRFRNWTSRNLDGLASASDLLSAENSALLDGFSTARQAGRLPFLRFVLRARIHRQSRLGNMSLLAGIMLNRI